MTATFFVHAKLKVMKYIEFKGLKFWSSALWTCSAYTIKMEGSEYF